MEEAVFEEEEGVGEELGDGQSGDGGGEGVRAGQAGDGVAGLASPQRVQLPGARGHGV